MDVGYLWAAGAVAWLERKGVARHTAVYTVFALQDGDDAPAAHGMTYAGDRCWAVPPGEDGA